MPLSQCSRGNSSTEIPSSQIFLALHQVEKTDIIKISEKETKDNEHFFKKKTVSGAGEMGQ